MTAPAAGKRYRPQRSGCQRQHLQNSGEVTRIRGSRHLPSADSGNSGSDPDLAVLQASSVHGESAADFVNGQKHLLVVVRHGAGAFPLLIYSGRIQVVKEDCDAATRDPSPAGHAEDPGVNAIRDRYVIRHDGHDGTGEAAYIPRTGLAANGPAQRRFPSRRAALGDFA